MRRREVSLADELLIGGHNAASGHSQLGGQAAGGGEPVARRKKTGGDPLVDIGDDPLRH